MPAGRSRSAITHWAVQGRCQPCLAMGCLHKSRSSELCGGSQLPQWVFWCRERLHIPLITLVLSLQIY